MKCPECGCENDKDYQFCRKCGAPRKDKINKIDSSSNGNSSNKIKVTSKGIFNKKTLILGLAIIVIIAIIAIGINSLDLGGVEPGNEKIINIDQSVEDEGSKTKYYLSFTLTNAPKQATTYYVKVSWYDEAGEVVGTDSNSLEYELIEDDNTMDIYAATTIPNDIEVSKCMIEVTDNQGQLVTSTSYNWMKY